MKTFIKTLVSIFFFSSFALAEGPGGTGTTGGGGTVYDVTELLPNTASLTATWNFPSRIEGIEVGTERCFGIPLIAPKCSIWAYELEVQAHYSKEAFLKGRKANLKYFAKKGRRRKQIYENDLRFEGRPTDKAPLPSPLTASWGYSRWGLYDAPTRTIEWDGERLEVDELFAELKKIEDSALSQLSLENPATFQNLYVVSRFKKYLANQKYERSEDTFSNEAIDDLIVKTLTTQAQELRALMKKAVPKPGNCDEQAYRVARARLANWDFATDAYFERLKLETGHVASVRARSSAQVIRTPLAAEFWTQVELPCTSGANLPPITNESEPTPSEEPLFK